MDRQRLLELAGIPVTETTRKPLDSEQERSDEYNGKKGEARLKTLTGKDLSIGLKNAGLNDGTHFGEVKFMKRIAGSPMKAHYLVTVEDDNEGTWDVTYIIAWYKDNEIHADFPGQVELEGFASKKYANQGLAHVARHAK